MRDNTTLFTITITESAVSAFADIVVLQSEIFALLRRLEDLITEFMIKFRVPTDSFHLNHGITHSGLFHFCNWYGPPSLIFPAPQLFVDIVIFQTRYITYKYHIVDKS